ncbi:helix-turn-helix transcriptional regulator [Actinoplanes solisilvae]|uniref:helix-turn-helix transcriptional regulator n=1 Tax=Actinoplanes solisilvae TaxID=2486853 RepID=UPI000FD89322|nr:LuxR family transcriptional regulator [Actinoplanes solisilvae]
MCTAPIERGAAVLTEVARTPTPPDAVGLCLRGMAVCRAGAFDEGVPLLDAAARQLRSQGRLRLLAQVLSIQAWAALELGDLTLAVPAADEAVRLAVETQGPFWRIGALIAQSAVAAFRGDETAVEALTAEADRVSVPAGAAYLVSLAQYARGVLELGRGRHAEAYEHLRRIRTPADAAYNRLCAIDSAGDFVEAAVRAGHQAEAETYLRECEVMADEARSRWVEVQLLVGRMQLADDESSFDEALSRDLSRWPMMRARIVLAHGEWLRRQRRAIESRRPLRAARDAFDAIGAVSWAERTRRELRAAGEGSRERPVDSLDELPPQEFQIVRMAAEGLSNSDIAARLLLSRRTIESHLYRAYPKLGVVSRAQIVTALGRRAATP